MSNPSNQIIANEFAKSLDNTLKVNPENFKYNKDAFNYNFELQQKKLVITNLRKW